MKEETLREIEQIIGYRFSEVELLKKAFTHSSAVDDRLNSNERLEFFGDSVLAVVICRSLYERFPDYLEGDLTKIKSMIVSRRTCTKVAKKLELQKFLKTGKGMSKNQALVGSLAAGVLEAVIGAIYLDGGFEAAGDFILKNFSEFLEEASAEDTQGNYKSMLQHYSQQEYNSVPVYELLDEKGPDHNKCFESQAVIDGRHFTSAWGTNKKEAEQKAAFNALVELGILDETFSGVDLE